MILGAIESMISSQSPKPTQLVPPPKPAASLSNIEIPPARYKRKPMESDEMEYIQVIIKSIDRFL